MIKLSNVLLTSALLLTLTACGGGSSTTTISMEDKEASIEKISSYAENSMIPPEKQDYINAGIDSNDLNFVDIDELNLLVKSKNSTEVDSEEELTALAQSIMDKVAPVITLNGSSVVNVILNTNYTDAGATAIDNKDGEVDVHVSGVVDTSNIGTYKLTYEASDRFNNTAIVTRTIYVLDEDKDIEAPTITLSSTSIKEQGDLASIATAVDNVDGNVDVTISGDTNTAVVGVHTVIYSARDSAGNEVRKEVAITVIPFTITELFSKSQELNDVSYLVVGDSTRYYEGINDVLINSRDSDAGYYKDLLNDKNIKFMHTSIEGQLVDYWLNGRIEDRNGGKSFTITDTLAKIGSVNPNHCIVEFSMGINDDLHGKILEVKENIKTAILKLKNDYPNVKILLVSPVPYYDFETANNSLLLNTKYEELKDELNLPFVSGFDILNVDYPDNTLSDKLHIKVETSKTLVNEIFEQIENDSLN
jgi:5-hydroxyisourate hydrolase-like protein (transthyretin family)